MTNEGVINTIKEERCDCCNFKKYSVNTCKNCMYGIAIDAIERSDKYRWHDLRKNPDDLPVGDDYTKYYECVHEKHPRGGYYPPYQYSDACGEFGMWENVFYDWSVGDMASEFRTITEMDRAKIIAWREIEPFEEEP